MVTWEHNRQTSPAEQIFILLYRLSSSPRQIIPRCVSTRTVVPSGLLMLVDTRSTTNRLIESISYPQEFSNLDKTIKRSRKDIDEIPSSCCANANATVHRMVAPLAEMI